jgi:hypothetical protein
MELVKHTKILLSISRRLYEVVHKNNNYIFSNILVELFQIHAKMLQRLNKVELLCFSHKKRKNKLKNV